MVVRLAYLLTFVNGNFSNAFKKITSKAKPNDDKKHRRSLYRGKMLLPTAHAATSIHQIDQTLSCQEGIGMTF